MKIPSDLNYESTCYKSTINRTYASAKNVKFPHYSCGKDHSRLIDAESSREPEFHKSNCRHVMGVDVRNQPLNSMATRRETVRNQLKYSGMKFDGKSCMQI